MTIVIDLQSEGQPFDKTRKRLDRIPQIVRDSLDNWGNNYLKLLMLRSAFFEGTEPLRSVSGDLAKGIKWVEMGRSNTGALTIIQSGVYVDSMRTHWVSVRRDRAKLLNWAFQSNNPRFIYLAEKVKTGELDGFGIRVHAHPFIRRGIDNSRRILPEVLQSDLTVANI